MNRGNCRFLSNCQMRILSSNCQILETVYIFTRFNKINVNLTQPLLYHRRNYRGNEHKTRGLRRCGCILVQGGCSDNMSSKF